jgi:hypothetical protein
MESEGGGEEEAQDPYKGLFEHTWKVNKRKPFCKNSYCFTIPNASQQMHMLEQNSHEVGFLQHTHSNYLYTFWISQ